MDETTEAVRARLGSRFEAEWSAGSGLDLGAAVELALSALDPA